MGAGHAMKRSARFTAVILLAGLVQISLSSVGFAESYPWEFTSRIDPVTDEATGTVFSSHENGDTLIFSCTKGEPIADFLALKSTQSIHRHPTGNVEVVWRIDSRPVINEIWKGEIDVGNDGFVESAGQPAYDFALAAMHAKNRIVFRAANRTDVFDAKGSTKAISRLIEFCRLK